MSSNTVIREGLREWHDRLFESEASGSEMSDGARSLVVYFKYQFEMVEYFMWHWLHDCTNEAIEILSTHANTRNENVFGDWARKTITVY